MEFFRFAVLMGMLCNPFLLAGYSESSELQYDSSDPHPNTLRVMTYNVWYVFAKGKEQEAGMQWVLEQTPDVVALQELTNIEPAKLQEIAQSWEHEHSALLKTEGFSVGLTSRWPIEVIERGRKGMHHGYLHAKTNDINYFVIHLSPFKWEVRERETAILLKKIQPLLRNGEQVIVLGDFNACSADDKLWLEATENAGLLKSKLESDEKHAHVQNLKNQKFHYDVLGKFLDSGLVDSAIGHLPKSFENRVTYPTGVFADKKTSTRMGQRIDFILMSSNLSGNLQDCRIPTQGVVNKISDHYPVIADIKQ